MSIINKGTYRFNDELVFDKYLKQDINFISNLNIYTGFVIRNYSSNDDYLLCYVNEGGNPTAYFTWENSGWNENNFNRLSQTIIIPDNAEVSEEFDAWFNANTEKITEGQFEISLKSLPKTEYKVGDALSVKDGVIVKHYNDGSTQEIKLNYSHIKANFYTNEPGTYTVLVYLEENGYTATTSYQITISQFIKAGAYRFNDEMTQPAASLTADIPFIVHYMHTWTAEEAESLNEYIDELIAQGHTEWERVSAGGTWSASASFTGLYIYVSARNDYWLINALGKEVLKVQSSTPIASFLVNDNALLSPSEIFHSMYETSMEEFKIIVVPEDALVSDEFYDWFTTNATEQKTVQGCWQWKPMNEISVPEVEYQLTEQVNFTAWGKGSFIYSGVELLCFMRPEPDGTSNHYNLLVMGTDIKGEDYYHGENGDWWDNSSIGLTRVFYFGDQPQAVSTEFYEFLHLHANPVDLDDFAKPISGVWKLHDKLQPVSYCNGALTIDNKSIGFACATTTSGEYADVYGIMWGERSEDVTNSNHIYHLVYTSKDGWVDGTIEPNENGDLVITSLTPSNKYQTLDLGKEPQLVPINVYNYFMANAANITDATTLIYYNGKVIGAPKANERAIIQCADVEMDDDIIVETTNCAYSHIIVVDELPTENIDTNALYQFGGKYYKPGPHFTDVIMYDNGAAMWLSYALQEVFGWNAKFYISSTKPTTDIKILDRQTLSLPMYYIIDEDDIFVYWESEWLTLTEFLLPDLSCGGTISFDAFSGMEEEHYYALIKDWTAYILPTGSQKCTENGIYGVADKAIVQVELVTALITPTAADLPAEAPSGSLAFVLGGD